MLGVLDLIPRHGDGRVGGSLLAHPMHARLRFCRVNAPIQGVVDRHGDVYVV